MTLTIHLTPEQEACLAAAAQQQGLDLSEMAHRLLTEKLPMLQPAQEDPTIALLTRWEQEDARRTTEEMAAEERLWETFEEDINAVRRAQGMRIL